MSEKGGREDGGGKYPKDSLIQCVTSVIAAALVGSDGRLQGQVSRARARKDRLLLVLFVRLLSCYAVALELSLPWNSECLSTRKHVRENINKYLTANTRS